MTHNTHHHQPHTQSPALYRNILLILLVLTAITVGVSRVDFGSFNIVVALLVASVKAILVMLFFMHLKFEDKIVWLYAFIPVFLIFIMIGGIYTDNPFRWENERVSAPAKEMHSKTQADKSQEGHGSTAHESQGHGEHH